MDHLLFLVPSPRAQRPAPFCYLARAAVVGVMGWYCPAGRWVSDRMRASRMRASNMAQFQMSVPSDMWNCNATQF